MSNDGNTATRGADDAMRRWLAGNTADDASNASAGSRTSTLRAQASGTNERNTLASNTIADDAEDTDTADEDEAAADDEANDANGGGIGMVESDTGESERGIGN